MFFNPLKVFLPLGAVMMTGALPSWPTTLTRVNLFVTAVLGALGALIVYAVCLLADQDARIAAGRP